MWFRDWGSVGRVVVLSIIGYVALTFLIRIFGKRTISKMNPGDFVITVAIGSIVASLILFDEVPLVNGLAALTSMVALQFALEWITARWTRLRSLVDGSPTLLVHHGVMLRRNMRRENIDEEDVLEALRQRGVANLADARAVVLEIDGSFSVIATSIPSNDASALRDVPTSS